MSKRAAYNEEDVEKAYRLQVLGAREGFIKGTIVSTTLMLLCNWRFPFVRRQTLAGKMFLTSWGSIYGMVTYADKYLLDFEESHRVNQERWRNQARSEIAASGGVPNESAMRRWLAKKQKEEQGLAQSLTEEVSVLKEKAEAQFPKPAEPVPGKPEVETA